MEINIQIEGAKELAQKWGAMSEDLKALAHDAFSKAGYVVEEQSKKLTPVDTGRLRGSINTSSRLTMKNEPHIVISPHTNYAVFVHEGTRFMPARPYMTQGYKNSERKIKSIMNKLLKDIVQKMK